MTTEHCDHEISVSENCQGAANRLWESRTSSQAERTDADGSQIANPSLLQTFKNTGFPGNTSKLSRESGVGSGPLAEIDFPLRILNTARG
jgi:hypothetical protein